MCLDQQQGGFAAAVDDSGAAIVLKNGVIEAVRASAHHEHCRRPTPSLPCPALPSSCCWHCAFVSCLAGGRWSTAWAQNCRLPEPGLVLSCRQFSELNVCMQSILPVGAVLQRLVVPDARGVAVDVVLGYDDANVYAVCPAGCVKP